MGIVMFNSLLTFSVIWSLMTFTDVNCGRPPRIIEHPADMTVALHEPATLNCKSDGQPKPETKWYKDGRPVDTARDSRKALLPDGSLLFLEAAHGKRDSDSGTYWCIAFNSLGEAVSKKANLVVTYLRQDFRVQPKDANPASGDTVVLECESPKGHPEPSVTWHKNGEPMPEDDKNRWIVEGNGNLIIRDVRSEDDGSYTCVASNAAGIRKSKPVLLAAQMRPYVIQAPKDTIAMAGSSVQLQCKIGGQPQPEILWKKISANGVTQHIRPNHFRNEKLSGDRDTFEHVYITQDGSLRLDNVSPEDEGKYVCHAENHQGKVNAASTLTVHSVPFIAQRPADTHVSAGSNAIFECGIRGNPKPTLFWSLQDNDSVIFPNESWNEFHAEVTKDSVSTLIIHNVNKEHHNHLVVMCSAINEAGSDEWRATLTVTTASHEDTLPPIIEYGPANQTLPYNSIGNLVCKSIGNPQPVITWYKDDSPLSPETPRINITETGTLQIMNLQKSDNGIYTCVASSMNGKASWSAELKMESPKNPNVGFFRSPDPSTFPGAPSSLTVINHTDTTVTLSWSRNGKVGSSPLLGYQVEMFTYGENVGWVTLTRRLLSTHFTQHFLKPGQSYLFLIRAENSHGLSPPSHLSNRVTLPTEYRHNEYYTHDMSIAKSTLYGGHIVDLIDIKTVNSTSIKLFWEVLNGEFLEGFYLYYRGKNSIGHESTLMKILSNTTELSGAYVINQLHPSVTYIFFLVPFYKHIKGRPSNSRIAKTLEDYPSLPPQRVVSTVYNSSSVYLKWDPPPDDSHNGIITNYQIIIQGGINWDVLSNVTVSANTPTLLLTNLTSGVRYKVMISAATKIGFGPYTDPIPLPTDIINKISNFNDVINDHEEIKEFVAEPWFIVLMAGVITLMILLFAAILYVRYRQLDAKKAHLGDSLNPVNKLSYSSSFKTTLDAAHRGQVSAFLQSEHSVSNSQRCLFIDSNSYHKHNWTHHDIENNEKDSIQKLLPEIADYAEVNPNTMSTFVKDRDLSSPAPYATTTLVSNSNSRNLQIRRNSDDAAYASANIYRGQHVYSESAYSCCSSNNDCQNCSDDCGNMHGVPVSVILSGCGRKTFNEVAHQKMSGSQRFNNYPQYSSRQRAMVRTTCSSNGYHYVEPSTMPNFTTNYNSDCNMPPDLVTQNSLQRSQNDIADSNMIL
ncbi:roundabout homolog 2-like [Daktulosphaira vitifoliae]|uniref:roundabout homolog 2-like n=1 Tax=Daktulosphaira vitifoliae TaxID=58002 RepID=UPI0021A9C5BA|nr:roundabout homolog 2-like [Daktulosphaira vitifoliae]